MSSCLHHVECLHGIYHLIGKYLGHIAMISSITYLDLHTPHLPDAVFEPLAL